MNKMITLVLFFSSLLASGVSFADTYAEEVKDYQEDFSTGNFQTINRGLGDLSWRGVSDERVFDPVLDAYNKVKVQSDKQSLKETVTLAKGLAYSGNKKYRDVIAKDMEQTGNRKLKKYYAKFLDSFDRYAKWNPIIGKDVEKAADADKKRVENMLNAKQAELIGMGAKRAQRSFAHDKGIMEKVNKTLLAMYKDAGTREEVDAASHLAKALGASGNSEYRKTLDEVAANAGNKKLRKYAKKFAAQL